MEKDPNGIDQHAPGAKLDHGKVMGGLIVDFGLALLAVAKVGTFGANKYTRGGWQHVKNGPERYRDAMMRHLLKECEEEIDADSQLPHEFQTVWNALASLQLKIKNNPELRDFVMGKTNVCPGVLKTKEMDYDGAE